MNGIRAANPARAAFLDAVNVSSVFSPAPGACEMFRQARAAVCAVAAAEASG